MWPNEMVITVIEDLQLNACLWDVHMQITETVIKNTISRIKDWKKIATGQISEPCG